MTSTWPKEKIMDLLSSAFAPQLARSPRPHLTEPPTPTIDVLITFDAHGISSHPNHISLYYGARHFISSLTGNNPGWQCPVNLYILTSTNILRKYSSCLDALISMGLVFFQRKSKGNYPSSLFFISGPKELRTAQQAMTNAHVSQMKWFRWGWIWLSRYMVVNDLKLDKVS
jgi:N-acetylglucosaminylphosphatidylinositol deacetylase